MDEKNTFFFEIIDNKFDLSINKSYILPLYFFIYGILKYSARLNEIDY
jgi:hypothetical protein